MTEVINNYVNKNNIYVYYFKFIKYNQFTKNKRPPT